MTEIIRAIYEQGQLRPLDPLTLSDGQEIRLAVLSEREQAQSALADILPPIDVEQTPEVDETAMLTTIDAAMRGAPSVSEALLDERREGP